MDNTQKHSSPKPSGDPTDYPLHLTVINENVTLN